MNRLAALALAAWMAFPAQAPSSSVTVHAWAGNDSSLPLVNLEPADFEVIVDGQPVLLESVTPRKGGAAVVLLLDTTRSTDWTPRPFDDQLGTFASSLGSNDRLMLATVGETISFSPFRPASHDIRDEVRRAVESGGDRGTGNSPIWDAIHQSVTILAAEPAPRMILVLSDGRATGNRYGLVEVADYAMANGVMINIILRHTPQRIRQSEETAALIQPGAPLEGLTTYTGGVLFFYPQFQDVQARARFAQIASVLSALHAFTFVPPNRDGHPHRLEVRSKRPGVKVHAPIAFLAR